MLDSPSAVSVGAVCREWIGKISVFLVLGGLGWYGHHTNWRLPGMGGPGASTAKPAAASPVANLSTMDGNLRAAESQPLVQMISEEAVERMGIRTETVRRSELVQTVAANGLITYDQSRVVQLSSRVPGVIWRVEKQIGDTVRKGDTLAILSSSDVGKAKADYLHAVLNVDRKTRNQERLKSISNVVAGRQLIEAEAELREAKFERFNAEQALLSLGIPIQEIGQDIRTDVELARAIHFLGLPETLARELDPKSVSANLIPIVAPFDGVLIGRDVVVGEVVQPSANSDLVVADVSRMWIRFDVRAEDAALVAPGQTAEFTPDGTEDRFACEVLWIGTEVDPKTRTVMVRAQVENPVIQPGSEGREGRRALRANTFGTGRIQVRRQPGAILVPNVAVQFDGEQQIAFIPGAAPHSYEAVPVEVGITYDGKIEIREGLLDGDEFVVAGSHALKSELQRLRAAAGSTEPSTKPASRLPRGQRSLASKSAD